MTSTGTPGGGPLIHTASRRCDREGEGGGQKNKTYAEANLRSPARKTNHPVSTTLLAASSIPLLTVPGSESRVKRNSIERDRSTWKRTYLQITKHSRKTHTMKERDQLNKQKELTTKETETTMQAGIFKACLIVSEG